MAAQSSFTTQVAELSGIAILMTVGVYGLVAGIVAGGLTLAGVMLVQRSTRAARS